MRDRFTSRNNTRPVPRNWWRVWRYGESVLCRTIAGAIKALELARRLDPDAHAVNDEGTRVPWRGYAQTRADDETSHYRCEG